MAEKYGPLAALALAANTDARDACKSLLCSALACCYRCEGRSRRPTITPRESASTISSSHHLFTARLPYSIPPSEASGSATTCLEDRRVLYCIRRVTQTDHQERRCGCGNKQCNQKLLLIASCYASVGRPVVKRIQYRKVTGIETDSLLLHTASVLQSSNLETNEASSSPSISILYISIVRLDRKNGESRVAEPRR